jgi:hypothetical protein
LYGGKIMIEILAFIFSLKGIITLLAIAAFLFAIFFVDMEVIVFVVGVAFLYAIYLLFKMNVMLVLVAFSAVVILAFFFVKPKIATFWSLLFMAFAFSQFSSIREPEIITIAVFLIFIPWFVKWFFADSEATYQKAIVEQNEIRIKQEEKLIGKQIQYIQLKIDTMKKNGRVGSFIDNLAGNSIANEKAKIVELEKKRNYSDHHHSE